jgi:hypothetical protein
MKRPPRPTHLSPSAPTVPSARRPDRRARLARAICVSTLALSYPCCSGSSGLARAASGEALTPNPVAETVTQVVAQASRDHRVLVGPLAGAVKVDGRLDEADWARAERVPDFLQWSPNRGELASFATEAHVLADARYLYIGARLTHDSSRAPLVALVHRRDVWEYTDLFRVWFDPHGDGRQAVIFGVNAANVQQDGWMSDNGESVWDWSWSAVWESATTQDANGWNLEMKIPRSVMPRGKGEDAAAAWRVYFDRFVPGANEVQGSVVGPREAPFLSTFAPLEGLKPPAGGPRLELVPYLLDRRSLEHAEASDHRGGERRAGLDVRAGFGDRALLDLALLPDAGFVESDPAVLNLSTVETLLPEKRAFFLEGADLFRVPGVQLFHSRRIGAGVDPLDVEDGERLVEQPQSNELLGAVKLRGHLGDGAGASYALLVARTDDAFASVRETGGDRRLRLAEPGAWTAVARVTQPLDLPERLASRGSSVGLFTSRLDSPSEFGNDATVAALDGVFNLFDGRTRASGLLAWSDTREGLDEEEDPAGAPRPEGERGRLFHAVLRQSFGGGLFSRAELRDTSVGFDPNDLGYLARADERHLFVDTWRTRDFETGAVGTLELRLSLAESTDQAGRTFDRRMSTGSWAAFRNGWSLNGDLGYSFDADDDRELRTFDDRVKQYLPVPGFPFLAANFESPTSTPLFLEGRVLFEGRDGGSTYQAAVDPRLRLGAHWMVKSGLRYRREHGGVRWIDSVEAPGFLDDVPLIGNRSLREREVSLRLGYAPGPRLSFEIYSQWLAADWSFGEVSHYAAGVERPGLPAGVEAPERFEAARSWLLNGQARWEYRPGSTLLVAYQQASEDEALVRRALDPSSLSRLPSERSLQVKLSWFWGR